MTGISLAHWKLNLKETLEIICSPISPFPNENIEGFNLAQGHKVRNRIKMKIEISLLSIYYFYLWNKLNLSFIFHLYYICRPRVPRIIAWIGQMLYNLQLKSVERKYWGININHQSILIPCSCQNQNYITKYLEKNKNGFQLRKMSLVCMMLFYK